MTLFDHVKNLYGDKIKFDDMSKEDKSTYLPYMVNRFLSMNPNLLWMVNLIQQYSIPPREHHIALSSMVPKDKRFYKYIKSESSKENDKELSYIMKYYDVSKKRASEYFQLFQSTETGRQELTRIMEAYGD